MLSLDPLRNLYSPSPAVGDRRWKVQPPNRPLLGILAANVCILVTAISALHVYAAEDYWVRAEDWYTSLFGAIFVTIGVAFAVFAALDITLFYKHRLNPIYAVSIASIWSAGWISAAAIMCKMCSPMVRSLYTGDPFGAKVVPVLYATFCCANTAFYLWYLVLAVKTFRRWKHEEKERVELKDCV